MHKLRPQIIPEAPNGDTSGSCRLQLVMLSHGGGPRRQLFSSPPRPCQEFNFRIAASFVSVSLGQSPSATRLISRRSSNSTLKAWKAHLHVIIFCVLCLTLAIGDQRDLGKLEHLNGKTRAHASGTMAVVAGFLFKSGPECSVC